MPIELGSFSLGALGGTIIGAFVGHFLTKDQGAGNSIQWTIRRAVCFHQQARRRNWLRNSHRRQDPPAYWALYIRLQTRRLPTGSKKL